MSSLVGRVKAWLAEHPEEARDVEARTRPPAPGPVTDLAGVTHLPFVMTPELRKSMAQRVALAVPTNARDVVDVERMDRIQGLPVDVLLVLESIAVLADNGNAIAARILVDERRRLGIDPGQVSYRKE